MDKNQQNVQDILQNFEERDNDIGKIDAIVADNSNKIEVNFAKIDLLNMANPGNTTFCYWEASDCKNLIGVIFGVIQFQNPKVALFLELNTNTL